MQYRREGHDGRRTGMNGLAWGIRLETAPGPIHGVAGQKKIYTSGLLGSLSTTISAFWVEPSNRMAWTGFVPTSYTRLALG